MKRLWETDELIATFTLTAEEIRWLGGRAAASQLGRATLLKSLQYEGRFPEKRQEVPPSVVSYLAQQLGVHSDDYAAYDWSGRTGKSDRAAIRQRLGFRPVREDDYAHLMKWLSQHPILHEDHQS